MSDVTLTGAEREAYIQAVDGHTWPAETDDGLVMRCKCGLYPPTHTLGSQVDEGFWLWQHALAERVATIQRILAARLSQEREQVRAERDREWRAWCAAMQDEWRALRDGVLSPGLRRAADDLDRDWSRQMVERRGRESFAQDGPRLAQEGELCSTCGGSFDSPPCSLNRDLGLSGHTRAGGVVAADVSPHPSPDSHEWLGMDR